MSTQRGSNSRTRPQKYKNRTAFKNDLHDKTPQMKKMNSLHVCEVCSHCKGVIEWKIKYKKYKPLSKPKTCIRCDNRNVKKAYHVICRDCAVREKVCAKCLKSSEEVEIVPPEPTEEEQIQLKVEMERLIKSLPERKRRTFQRYMEKGKKNEELEATIEQDETQEIEGTEKGKTLKSTRIPHSREDLLKKIEFLKIDEDDDDEDDDNSFFDDSEEESSEEN